MWAFWILQSGHHSAPQPGQEILNCSNRLKVFSEIAPNIGPTKKIAKSRKLRENRLFLIFPHEKMTFQWSKVVSEAIFPTN